MLLRMGAIAMKPYIERKLQKIHKEAELVKSNDSIKSVQSISLEVNDALRFTLLVRDPVKYENTCREIADCLEVYNSTNYWRNCRKSYNGHQ